MIKKITKLLIILTLPLLLTGCWDYEDLNKKCIVVSIGVDKIKDNYQFSGEIAKVHTAPENATGEAQSTNVYNLLSYGKTLEEARLNYDAINPYPTFLGATSVVIFGSNFAKAGIEPYINRVDHLYDYKKTVLACVSREPLIDLFKVKVDKDFSVGFLIENILNHSKNQGEALYPNISDLVSTIHFGKTGYLLPYIGIERKTIKYLGLAIMKNSQLIATLPIKDTDGILYILAKKPFLAETITSKNNKKNILSFRTLVKKRTIKTDYKDDNIIINIDLDLNAELRYQYYSEKISDTNIAYLEKKISDKVKNDILTIIEKSQKDYKCDIFQFAKHFRAQHFTKFNNIDWEEKFPDASINVQVKSTITNLNLLDPQD